MTDKRINDILVEIKDLSINTFKDNLVGIYVHGSIAFDCFNYDQSDIDYIVVINKPLSVHEKEEYISKLLLINENSPSKGIEMSIVLLSNTINFIYPTPFELHFSNYHLPNCLKDIKKYCENMNGTDKDLAAHFTVIKQKGIVLYGKQIEEVFGIVSPVYFFDSLKYDLLDAINDISENPVYFILNYSRVLAYKQEGIVISKKDGGVWALNNLDKKYHLIIQKALNNNIYSTPFIEVTTKELNDFVSEMYKKIFLFD